MTLLVTFIISFLTIDRFIYTYPIGGSRDMYGNSTNAQQVLISLNCTEYYSCNFATAMVVSTDSCNSYGGDAVISCTSSK